jgi:hypothetical protein
MLHSAIRLADLRVPPGNQLELLYKDREGQHSIRINDQFRVCFAPSSRSHAPLVPGLYGRSRFPWVQQRYARRCEVIRVS